MRKAGALVAVAFFSVVIEACAPSLQGNEPREVRREVPKSYGPAGGPADRSVGPTSLAEKKWSEVFSDVELGALIDSALKNNQEMNLRIQEIVIAQAEVSAKQGEILPRLDAVAGAGLEKPGKYTSQGTSDEAHGLPDPLGSLKFGLVASWEIDLWGKLRAAKSAAGFRYLASIEGRKFMQTELVAEIARSYYELIALDRQIEVLNKNIAIQKDALEVARTGLVRMKTAVEKAIGTA